MVSLSEKRHFPPKLWGHFWSFSESNYNPIVARFILINLMALKRKIVCNRHHNYLYRPK